MILKRSCIIVLCTLLVSGCARRYWYRTKIDVPHSNKYSVQIRIINEAPGLLNKEFVEAMHQAAAGALRKKGYFEAPVKSPAFVYKLTLKVDTFNRSAHYYDKHHVPDPGNLLLGNYNSTLGVRAIMFESQLDYGKEAVTKWMKFFDIYYLGEKRDISRSKGVVKFLIRTAEEGRY